jgi:small subunit ribosomal protein S2
MTRLPAAVFVVDITKEHIAISEARKLNIPTFAIVDTNSNPNLVDFAIPANDDSSTSIRIVVDTIVKAIKEGLEERKEAQVQNKLQQDDKKDNESSMDETAEAAPSMEANEDEEDENIDEVRAESKESENEQKGKKNFPKKPYRATK